MFNLILSKLADRGVSPRRIGQVVTDEGIEFSSDSPFIYDDEDGDEYVVSSYFGGYMVTDGFGERIAIGDHPEHVNELLPEILHCPMYRQ